MNDHTTKAKILEALYRLIAEKGYDKASIGRLADAIGIKKASIYYYFKSKEDIFIQLVKELYKDDFSNKAHLFSADIGRDDYREELLATGERFIDSYFENKDLRKVYAEIDIQTTRIPALKAFLKSSDESFNQFLVECVSRGVTVGAFSPETDCKLTAQILYTTLVGIDQAILYELPIDPKAVWREVVFKLFEGKAHSSL